MQFSPLFTRNIKINEASLGKGDLKRLFSIIDIQREKSIEIQIAQTNPNLFENFETVKEEIRSVLRMSFSISKKLGDEIHGFDIPKFDDADFPEKIVSVFASTKETFLTHAKYPPRNHIEMFLDFRKPPISIDLITMPSNPTHNGSVINVVGFEEAWVVETYLKIKDFLDEKYNKRKIIHGSGIFDLFLYTIVIPVFLYALFRFEIEHPNFIDSVPKVTIIAIYVYSFLLIGLAGRLIFQYTRWLFPLVEYNSGGSWGPPLHRAIWLFVLGGVFTAAIYDMLKFFLG